jgi:hypothetical protein
VYDVRRGNPQFDDQAAAAARRSQGSLLPVLMVLGFALAVIVGLIAATGLAGVYVVLALAGVLAFAGLHYVLWGWWLANRIRRQQEADGSDRDD